MDYSKNSLVDKLEISLVMDIDYIIIGLKKIGVLCIVKKIL